MNAISLENIKTWSISSSLYRNYCSTSYEESQVCTLINRVKKNNWMKVYGKIDSFLNYLEKEKRICKNLIIQIFLPRFYQLQITISLIIFFQLQRFLRNRRFLEKFFLPSSVFNTNFERKIFVENLYTAS